MTLSILILPLLSLFVERIIEFIDTWIVLQIFPWWVSEPTPPPKMLMPKPNKAIWKGNDKITLTVEGNKAEIIISSYEEALYYYQREEKLHHQRLAFYIRKYGYFWDETYFKKTLRWWFFKPVRNSWQILAEQKENRLAEEVGVSNTPGDANLAKIILDDQSTEYIFNESKVRDLLANKNFTKVSC